MTPKMPFYALMPTISGSKDTTSDLMPTCTGQMNKRYGKKKQRIFLYALIFTENPYNG